MTTITVTPVPRTAHRPASPDRREQPAGVRLTRRGRAALVLGLLGVLLVAGFALGSVSSSHAAGTPSSRTVVVQPGDTLWTIAARVEPQRDTREVVATLSAMNHLRDASLQVGERLTVPS